MEEQDNMMILNENQQEMYKELSEVKNLIKDALTPKEQKEAEEASKPLSRAELEKYENEKEARKRQEQELLDANEERVEEIQETFNAIEDKTVDWLEAAGVDIKPKHQKLFDTFLHEAVRENKGKYNNDTQKFWAEVSKSVKASFKETLNLNVEEGEDDFTPTQTSKWSRSKGKGKDGKKPDSMTMASDSTSFTARDRDEITTIKEKLINHKEGRDKLTREQIYLLQSKLQSYRN